VRQVCDRVLILHHGRLVAEGAPDELTAGLQDVKPLRVQVRAPKDAPVIAVLSELEGIADVRAQDKDVYVIDCTQDTDARAQVTQAILQAGWELLELRAIEMSLEDVFLQLTVDEARM
jgi:ABC-2 type transport system ATP-binding protein